ncbi:MAG TPA: c-type cytochrome [Candidatus Didemnitutus sp.]|nr:c-type cytochrome [Candidatus Didemnitutus sp.]
MHKILVPLVLLGAAVSCRADATLDASVLKIFDEKCADCHSPTKHKNEKAKKPALDGATNLADLRQNTKAVHPGDPDSSKLYKVLVADRSDKDAMPKSTKSHPRDPLSADEIALIRKWIQGS